MECESKNFPCFSLLPAAPISSFSKNMASDRDNNLPVKPVSISFNRDRMDLSMSFNRVEWIILVWRPDQAPNRNKVEIDIFLTLPAIQEKLEVQLGSWPVKLSCLCVSSSYRQSLRSKVISLIHANWPVAFHKVLSNLPVSLVRVPI